MTDAVGGLLGFNFIVKGISTDGDALILARRLGVTRVGGGLDFRGRPTDRFGPLEGVFLDWDWDQSSSEVSQEKEDEVTDTFRGVEGWAIKSRMSARRFNSKGR